MNLQKLREAEKEFFEKYPGGFKHPEMVEKAKKHIPDKMHQMALEFFKKENFKNGNFILESMVKLISRSSLVSLFEKPKFRDHIHGLSAGDRLKLVTGLEEQLYGKKDERQSGFNMVAEVLQKGKLAKWSLISICPFYFSPQNEVFMKPTTVKNVISFFEINGLDYKPRPTFEFYSSYKKVISEMKKNCDASLSPDNAYFSGFLMMAMEHNG